MPDCGENGMTMATREGSADRPARGSAGRRRGKQAGNGNATGVPSGGGPGRRRVKLKKMTRELEDLRSRVADLEQEMKVSRQLSKRLAEITDVVAEVLLPAEQRDEARLRELLAAYQRAF